MRPPTHVRSYYIILLASPSSPFIPRCCSFTLLFSFFLPSAPPAPPLAPPLVLSSLFLPSCSAPPPTASSRLRPPCTRCVRHRSIGIMVWSVWYWYLLSFNCLLFVYCRLLRQSLITAAFPLTTVSIARTSLQHPASGPFPPSFRLRLQWSLCFPCTPPMSAPCPNRQARSADLRPLQSPTLATVTWGPSLRPSHACSSAAPPRRPAALDSGQKERNQCPPTSPSSARAGSSA